MNFFVNHLVGGLAEQGAGLPTKHITLGEIQVARNRNTDIYGKPFAGTNVGAVWQKGQPIQGYDPGSWRRDVCGNAMKFDDYGNTTSQHGWEVDHINPVSKGGSDQLSNLQPLQWDNNRRKGDTYPWNCAA